MIEGYTDRKSYNVNDTCNMFIDSHISKSIKFIPSQNTIIENKNVKIMQNNSTPGIKSFLYIFSKITLSLDIKITSNDYDRVLILITDKNNKNIYKKTMTINNIVSLNVELDANGYCSYILVNNPKIGTIYDVDIIK